MAYDLESGEQKWKWTGDGPAYASPALMNVAHPQVIIATTEGKLVALNAADGTLLYQVTTAKVRYNAASPIIAGQTLIYAGPGKGTTAEKIELQDDKLVATALWKNGPTAPCNSIPRAARRVCVRHLEPGGAYSA